MTATEDLAAIRAFRRAAGLAPPSDRDDVQWAVTRCRIITATAGEADLLARLRAFESELDSGWLMWTDRVEYRLRRSDGAPARHVLTDRGVFDLDQVPSLAPTGKLLAADLVAGPACATSLAVRHLGGSSWQVVSMADGVGDEQFLARTHRFEPVVQGVAYLGYRVYWRADGPDGDCGRYRPYAARFTGLRTETGHG